MELKTKYIVAVAAAPIFLLVAWPTNAQAFWGSEYGGWGHGVGDYWGSDGYGSVRGYTYIWQSGYNQGYSDAQSNYQPVADCGTHSNYWCQGYNSGYNAYTNINTSQQQTQSSEVNIRGNNNIVGISQEQSSGLVSQANSPTESYDNGNGNGYTNNDSGYPNNGQNPECRVLCLSISR